MEIGYFSVSVSNHYNKFLQLDVIQSKQDILRVALNWILSLMFCGIGCQPVLARKKNTKLSLAQFSELSNHSLG